ncbi:MAG: helix-turn-helix transcriptional regulator [Pseudomonadota bacterium]
MIEQREDVARERGLPGLVERFTELVGTPPIRYLTCWRLHTAKLQLRETRRSIADLAHSLGYDSEEAFSRAFKRTVGVSPARWREQERVA